MFLLSDGIGIGIGRVLLARVVRRRGKGKGKGHVRVGALGFWGIEVVVLCCTEGGMLGVRGCLVLEVFGGVFVGGGCFRKVRAQNEEVN